MHPEKLLDWVIFNEFLSEEWRGLSRIRIEMRSDSLSSGLLVALLGALWAVGAASLSDVPPPQDYVRRSQMSATVIGNYVYIDGGELLQYTNGKILERKSNQVNSTLSIDMSKSWTTSDVVLNTINRPWWSKCNQVIWTDRQEGTFYVWAGKWAWGLNMTKNELWKFTPDGKGGGTWALDRPANADLFNDLHQAEFGAYANSNDTGFVIGGIASGWTELYRANTQVLPGMVAFNMKTKSWQNGTKAFSPFPTLAGASAHYVPFGPDGLIMVLGGMSHSVVGEPIWGDATPYDFRNLTFFNPQTKQKYWQVATGNIPPSPRAFFCLAGFQNTDGGYEIFLSGGSNPRDRWFYDDTYILSLPGFVWTKAPVSPAGKRAYGSCVSVGSRQMLSVGGDDGEFKQDPAPQGLLLFDMTEMKWKDSYDAKSAAYERHVDLKERYNNGSLDAIQWSSDEVRQLFGVKSSVSKTPTSTPAPYPTNTLQPVSESQPTQAGAIAGGVVGGVAGFAIIGAIAWWFLRRRRNSESASAQDKHDLDGPYTPGGVRPDYTGQTELPAYKPVPAELQSESGHRELSGNTTFVNPLAHQPMEAVELGATPVREEPCGYVADGARS